MLQIARGLVTAGLLLSLCGIAACGEDKIERGLTVDDEVASPESAKEMGETEKERDREFVDEMQESEEN